MNDDIRARLMAEMLIRIEKHGWTCTAVLPDAAGTPGFTYSIAIEATYGAPEVVLVSFDPNLAQQIIAEIAPASAKVASRCPRTADAYPGSIRDFAPDAGRPRPGDRPRCRRPRRAARDSESVPP